jgi:hypothetical protein
MRSNLKLIAAAFIPLGFLGGLLDGSLVTAIGSAVFWGAVFLFLNSRKPTEEHTSDEFFPKSLTSKLFSSRTASSFYIYEIRCRVSEPGSG